MHIIAQSKSTYQKMTKEVLLLFVTLPLYVMFMTYKGSVKKSNE